MKKQLKFNDYVKSFPHEIFGELTIIKSHKEEDSYWFIGKEIQNVLGFYNLSQAITQADLHNDEFLIIEKKNNRKLFNDFIRHYEFKGDILKIQPSEDPIISKYSNSVTLISESGLYGLIMTSRKPIAKEFKSAVRKDILPAVRKMYEKFNDFTILNHELHLFLNREVQLAYSKWFNRVSVEKGGALQAMKDNLNISLRHTGITPKEWKKKGREKAVELGFAESKIKSGLDGIRLLAPEKSACITTEKAYLERGLDANTAFILTNSKNLENYFIELYSNGIMPFEYKENKFLNEK